MAGTSRDVACPECGAAAGARCTTARNAHVQRTWAWNKATRAAEEKRRRAEAAAKRKADVERDPVGCARILLDMPTTDSFTREVLRALVARVEREGET